jgi:hypothetical protein
MNIFAFCFHSYLCRQAGFNAHLLLCRSFLGRIQLHSRYCDAFLLALQKIRVGSLLVLPLVYLLCVMPQVLLRWFRRNLSVSVRNRMDWLVQHSRLFIRRLRVVFYYWLSEFMVGLSRYRNVGFAVASL